MTTIWATRLIIKQKSKIINKVHLNVISRVSKIKEDAYNTKEIIARKWINNALYRQVIDVLSPLDTHNETIIFVFMRK